MLLLAAVLILLAAVAVFASQNAHMVAVNLLGWHLSWPLAGVVLVSLVAGALVTFLVVLFKQVRLRLKIHDAEGRFRRTESELTSIRSELAKVKAELEKTKAALAEKEQDLVALRAELAGKAAAEPKGGGSGGSGGRRG